MKKLLFPALLLLAAARPALAQDFPNHPIRMIVPFAAGSTPDIRAHRGR